MNLERRINVFALGFIGGLFFAAFIASSAMIVASQTASPAEPPKVFGAPGAMTVESLVDEMDSPMRRFIEAECPWGTRWAAHKLCRWQLRRAIHVQIALHGQQAASGLRAVEPLSRHLFKREYAEQVTGLRELCETDVRQFGPIAEGIRAEAGPVQSMAADSAVGAAP